MPAQRRRPARLDRRHDAALGAAEVVGVGLPVGRAVAAEDIRHLQHGTHGAGSGGRGDRIGHDARRRLQGVQRAGGGAHFAGRQPQVAGGGAQAAVAEQQLDGAQIGAGLQQVDGEGMAQGVRRDRLADVALEPCRSAGDLDGAWRDRLAGQIAGKQPLLRPGRAPVVCAGCPAAWARASRSGPSALCPRRRE